MTSKKVTSGRKPTGELTKNTKPKGRVYETRVPYDEIMAKYQTGEYSMNQLAKMYKVGVSTISEYIARQSIVKSENAISAVEHLSKGFYELMQIKNDERVGDEFRRTMIVDEVLEIIKAKNPMFAKTIQALSSKLLEKSFEMLERASNPKELNNLASVMQKVNETLQVIPKIPNTGTQINIQNNQNTQNIQNTIEGGKIVFELVPPQKNDNIPIEAEIIDE